MGIPPASTDAMELAPAQRDLLVQLARRLRLLSVALCILGVVWIVTGVLRLFLQGSFWGLLFLVMGGCTVFLTMVVATAAREGKYTTDVKGYEKPHLLLLTRDLRVFFAGQLVLGLILAIVFGLSLLTS
jgi:hypothetical protein